MAVATPCSPEVTRLETGREAIFEGFRLLLDRDRLVEDPAERGRGHIVPRSTFRRNFGLRSTLH
jgi:hypothetical protein